MNGKVVIIDVPLKTILRNTFVLIKNNEKKKLNKRFYLPT